VQVYLAFMPGIGSEYVFAIADRQQVVFSHDPQHMLVIDCHALTMQIRSDTPVAVPTMVRQHHLLDGRPYRHLRFVWNYLQPVPIITRPADTGQLAHPFYS